MRSFVCGSLIFSLAIAASTLAEEPACPCPNRGAHEVGVPMLSKIPYMSRLFKNVGVAEPACSKGTCEVRQIGVELELTAGEQPADAKVCRAGQCEVCPALACQVAATGACTCPGKCCPDGQCSCAAKACTADCCASAKSAAKEHALWEKIVDLAAGKAAAEAALEVQEDSLERTGDLLEALAGVHAEKAKLEAQLETQAQLHELASENARLKAQVELAEAKAEVMRATVEMTVENERLKMRLTELEGAAGKAARTASRPRGEKKSR